MGFPQWTEISSEEGDAIQYLRLNELRDHINVQLFPYLTTITPYLRLISWITWIYTKLYSEIIDNKISDSSTFFLKFKKYYSVFSVANILYSNNVNISSWGPIGVLALKDQIDNIQSEIIDFNHPTLANPLNPTPNYRTTLLNMKLLQEKIQPTSSRSNLSILTPTKFGETLSKAFQKEWENVFSINNLTNSSIFKKNKLIMLGKKIFLQGLEKDSQESLLLLKSIDRVFTNDLDVSEFITFSTLITNQVASINYYDVSESALYREIEKEGKKWDYLDYDSETIALLAYHELHSHLSFGADAILNSIVELAQSSGLKGLNLSTLPEKTLDSVPWRDEYSLLPHLIKIIDSEFKPIKSQYCKKVPPRNGHFGFKKMQNDVNNSKSKFQQLFFAALILLQSLVCYKNFNLNWINARLQANRDVFSVYSLIQEYESVPSDSSMKTWISTMIKLIIHQHDLVSDSKGAYSKRIDCSANKIYFLRPADYIFQRGRLLNAVTWISDLGFIKRTEVDYRPTEALL